MPRSARLLVPVLLLFFLGGQLLSAQSSSCLSDKKHPCNGISVGKPKVFDNRTLTLMIENLSRTLMNMQTGFINQQSVAAALGNIQGFQTHEVTSSFQVNPVPIPGVTQGVTNNTGNVDASGNILPNNGQSNTTQRQTTTTQNAFAPAPPTLDTTPAFSGFNPTYGENAADLLTDQVNLSYQIFNLRMILERALSDRLWTNAGESNSTRLQAVLGFNVTIDPPRTANDAVAVVEVTLTDQTHKGDLSLVALMPQEKTYNAASLSTKSNAFGGTAVVKTIQVGYSQRRRGQTFYLYRDNDTIAYERMDPTTNELIFGWMFRPVLGRRSVSPGMRQLFAVASLATTDCTRSENQARLDKNMEPCPEEKLSAKVRTYWKKYDAGTLSSFTPRDQNRATTLKYAVTFNLTRPQIFDGRYENEADYGNVAVAPSTQYQSSLSPTIERLWWVPVGAKSALISVVGNNFFTGTQVSLGDKTFTGAGDGLTLKSNQTFDLLTPTDALAAGPGAILGRYGTAVPLNRNGSFPSPGVSIYDVRIGPSLSGARSLDIRLMNRGGGALQIANLPVSPEGQQATPLIVIAGSTLPLPYSLVDVQDPDPNHPGSYIPHVLIQTSIADALASAGNDTVKVTWPLLSDIWTATFHITNPADAYQAIRVGDKGLLVSSKNIAGFVKDPRNPANPLASTQCWQLLAGDKPIQLKTSACSGGDASSEGLGPNSVFVTLKAAAPDKVVLLDPYGASFTLDIPKATASDTDKTKVVMLKQYDASWIDVAVDDPSKVGSVEANQVSLHFVIGPDGKNGEKPKSIKVEITRELTSKPGNIDLTVVGIGKDPKTITTVKLQIACTDCKNTDGGK